MVIDLFNLVLKCFREKSRISIVKEIICIICQGFMHLSKLEIFHLTTSIQADINFVCVPIHECRVCVFIH